MQLNQWPFNRGWWPRTQLQLFIYSFFYFAFFLGVLWLVFSWYFRLPGYDIVDYGCIAIILTTIVAGVAGMSIEERNFDLVKTIGTPEHRTRRQQKAYKQLIAHPRRYFFGVYVFALGALYLTYYGYTVGFPTRQTPTFTLIEVALLLTMTGVFLVVSHHQHRLYNEAYELAYPAAPAPPPAPPPDLLRLAAEHDAALPPESVRPLLLTLPQPAIVAYLKHLPRSEDGPFRQAFYNAANLKQFSMEFMPHLKDTPAYEAYYQNVLRMTPKKSSVFMWPQNYKGTNAEIYRNYFANSPLRPLFEVTTPFRVFDDHRFSHSWVMGKQRSGKTTLLSAQIWDDLQRMGQGECSIFVMDSQDKEAFVRSLVKLKQFAPGGKWHDKLVYIEPDLSYTPAINPLDIGDVTRLSENDRYETIQTASVVLNSLFSSLLDFPLTGKQGILFGYLVSAAVTVPKATLTTLIDLLKPGGYEQYRNNIAHAPPQTAQWFKDHMRVKQKGETTSQFKETAEELRVRLEGLMNDDLFARMLNPTTTDETTKVDLLDLLSEPRLVVINTMQGRLAEKKVEAFGRFFISQLLLTMQKRPERALKCFAYIDEATDYLKNDEKVATLIFKGRKQNMALTIAHHVESDLHPRVHDALQKAEVKYTPAKDYHWNVDINDGELKATVLPQHVDFSKMPLMSDREWRAVLTEQRAKYCVQYRKTPPASPAPPREFGKGW